MYASVALGIRTQRLIDLLFNSIIKEEIPNTFWFQLFQCVDLLPIVFSSHCKWNIFGLRQGKMKYLRHYQKLCRTFLIIFQHFLDRASDD